MSDSTDTLYNSDNFDLTDWELDTPLDSTGGSSGLEAIVTNLTDYTSPYFYSDPDDGSMVLTAMVGGATSANSSYTRSELREMNDGKVAAWNLAEGGTMTETLKIDSVPTLFNGTPGREIIGQIHGSSDELVKLWWDNGTIYFENDRSGSNGGEHKFLLTNAAGQTPDVPLGEQFSYKISAQGSTLEVDVYVNGQVYSSTTAIDPVWQSDSLYFKAGVYIGVNASTGTGTGQVSIYGLDFGHTPGSGLGGLVANAPPPTYTPPVAEADVFSGQENHAVSGNVLADNGHGADTDPNGLALSVAAGTITTAQGGAVVQNADGTFTYNPAAGFFGTDSFTYTLKDSAGLSTTGTATITVNAPPVAEADTFKGQENHAITGNVLADNGNGPDSDPNGDPLTVQAQTLATAHGSVVLNADGSFTYTPVAGFTGADSFSYAVSDGNGGSATATASLTLTAPPVAALPAVVVQALGGVTPAVTMTGTNGNDDMDGVHGSFNNVMVSGLSGNDTMMGHDGNDVLVGGTGNDALYGYYGNDIIYAGAGNSTLDGGPGNDTLIGGAGHDTVTGGTGSDTFIVSSGNGSMVINDFGTSAGNTDKLMVEGYTASELQSAQLTQVGAEAVLQLEDGASVTFLNTQISQLTSVNLLAEINGQQVALMQAPPPPPPVAAPDSFTGQENQAITGNVLANNGHGADTDPNGLALSVAAETLTTAHGSVVVSANGSFVYTPAAGFTGADSFAYTVSDGSGSATTTVSLTLTAPPANVIPEAVVAALGGVTPTVTMTGTNGNDYMDGVHGSANNVIMGLGGNDTIMGHDGNDVLMGGTGNDQLYGYYGNDVLYSGSGNNILNGGPGNDTLISGSGDNTLTGGGGNDVFVFAEPKTLNAHDIITDFNTSDNKLDISALLGQHGTAQLETVAEGTGLYINPEGTGASTLLVIFEGSSNVTIHTVLQDILV